MAQFQVTESRLREAAEVISSSSKDYRQTMEEIKNIMTTLDGAWRSEAASQYHAQFNKLNSNFDAYERALNQYSAYLLKAADEYAAVDQRTLEDTNVLDGSALFV